MLALTHLSFGLTHMAMCSTSMLTRLLLFHGKLTIGSLVQVGKNQLDLFIYVVELILYE